MDDASPTLLLTRPDAQSRDFLDDAAELSEAKGYFPDMGFGKDYVNVTVHLEDGNDDLTPEQRQFAEELDKLPTANPSE